MGQALYRKYRPKKLSEVVGEEHITSTLSNELKKGNLNHAYLFTGPRGVGKTSVARILAHEINDFKYDDDINHLDIIEIDAASNRRIDEIRQLRDRVNLAPSVGKYKVYIIDEVHMLTREAFNALLKTLEEPPSHVIFILATTEAYKVPETIISRTQQFNFRPISNAQIIKHLKKIAKNENIIIDNEALEIVADNGQGSFRDSIGLLDQASSIDKQITASELETLLGIAPSKLIDGLVKSLENNSILELNKMIQIIDDEGYSITQVCKQLIARLKILVIKENNIISTKDILILMKKLIDVPLSSDSFTSLEIVLYESVLKNKVNPDDVTSRTDNNHNKILLENHSKTLKEGPDLIIKELVTSTPKKIVKELINDKVEKDIVSEIEFTEKLKSNSNDKLKLDIEIWEPVLNLIKAKYNTLYGIIRMAVPTFNGSNVILKTKFDFHQRLLSDPKNQLIIVNFIKEITGENVSIKCSVDKTVGLEHKDPTSFEKIQDINVLDSSITNINNIFGSSEVLK